MTEKKLSTDAVAWAYEEFIKDDPKRVARLEIIRAQAAVARNIYRSRKRLNMTREDLATSSGLTQEVIEDIEESDYDGDWADAVEKIRRGFLAWAANLTMPSQRTEPPSDYQAEELNALLETLRQKRSANSGDIQPISSG